jgi:DNA-binding MarR family transcriptional regulator
LRDDPPARFTGPDDSPGFLLWEVANAWQRRQRQALEDLGLTHVQFVLLAVLDQLKNGDGIAITQRTLARYCRVNEMTASQVIRVLEDRGAVVREPHPNDGRAMAPALTPEGAELIEKAIPLVEQADAAFFLAAGGRLEGMIEVLRIIVPGVRDAPGRFQELSMPPVPDMP